MNLLKIEKKLLLFEFLRLKKSRVSLFKYGLKLAEIECELRNLCLLSTTIRKKETCTIVLANVGAIEGKHNRR